MIRVNASSALLNMLPTHGIDVIGRKKREAYYGPKWESGTILLGCCYRVLLEKKKKKRHKIHKNQQKAQACHQPHITSVCVHIYTHIYNTRSMAHPSPLPIPVDLTRRVKDI